MVEIHVQSDDYELKNTFLDGLNITVHDLELVISEEARNQQLLFAQRMAQQGIQAVEAKYANPAYWLNRCAEIYSSRVEWEIKEISTGVLFRISKVKKFTPKVLH